MAKDKQPPKTKKYFRSTKSGAGMTSAGVKRYRSENPGSKWKNFLKQQQILSLDLDRQEKDGSVKKWTLNT